jgi:hypothetical protein
MRSVLRTLGLIAWAISIPTAGIASFIPKWQQTWSTTANSSSGDPLLARELADGSRIVLTTTAVAVRYDANGSVLSQAALAPPFFVPILVGGGSAPSVTAIGANGTVFVASCSDTTNSTVAGDVWLTAYDGTTGAPLWPAPAVFDGTAHIKDTPASILLAPNGNPVLVGFEGRGGSRKPFVIEYDRATGARVWGPFVGIPGSDAQAALDPSGNVIVGSTLPGFSGLTLIAIFRLAAADGSVIGGPFLRGTGMFGSPSYSLKALRVDAGGDIVIDEATVSGREILKLSGASGSVLWGPVAEPDTTSALFALELTPSGDVVLGTEVNDHITLTEYLGSTGAIRWGPVADVTDATNGSPPRNRLAIAPDGSVLAAAWVTTGVPTVFELHTWKHASATGAVQWGPTAVPGFSGGMQRPVLAATAAGGAVEAISSSGAMQALELASASGNVLWGPTGFTAALPVHGRVWDVTQAPDGSVYVLGQALFPDIGFQWVTIKYDRATGATLWGPVYHPSNSIPYSVRTDAAGNAFIAGFDTNAAGIAVVKYASSDGHVLWSSILAGGADVRGFAIDSNGDVGVLDFSSMLSKLSGASGAMLWGPVGSGEFADFLAVTPSGDFVTFEQRTQPTFAQWATTKYSGATGSLLWGPVLMGNDQLSGYYINDAVSDPGGGVVVTGLAVDSSGIGRMTTIRYAANGSVVWGPVTLAGTNGGEAIAAALDSNGDVFVTGYDSGISGPYTFCTFKYRGTDGTVLWGPAYLTAPSGKGSGAQALALDGGGNPIVAGTALDESWAKDIVLAAYDGATGALNGAPATIGGGVSHDLPRHDLVVKGSSAVVAGSAESFLTAAFDITAGIVCNPNDPLPTVTVDPTPTCAGDTVTLRAPGFPGATYSWTGPNGFTSSLQSPAVLATPAAAGTYTVSIQAYGCSLPAASVDLQVGHAISTVITASLSAGTASVPDAGPGSLYLWSLPNGLVTSGNGSRSITFTYPQGLSFVTFLVSVVNSSGCSESGQLTVPVIGYFPLQPCRLVDTRFDNPLAANASRSFQAVNNCGIPFNATAIAVVPVAVAPGASGDLRLYPTGTAAPTTSALNFDAGRTRSSNAIIGLGGGQIDVLCDMPPGSTATTHFVLDVYGYFQ